MKQIITSNFNPCYENIINSYYENNAKKLNALVNKIFFEKYGGIANKDIDEFYGIATDVFIDICKHDRYNEKKGDFEGFLYNSLKFGIIDEMKKRQRDKRCYKIDELDENGNKILDENGKVKRKIIQDVSLDAPIQDSDNLTYKDTIQADFNIDVHVERISGMYSDKVKEYLNLLTIEQQKIAKLIMKGYRKKDIKELLGISEKKYQSNWKSMTAYCKKRILYEDNFKEDVKMNTEILMEDVTEKYKNTSYSIESIIKQLQKKRIRDDHILQRHSGQWKGFAKSELISDILRGKSFTQIIICEEIRNGLKMQWLIDGKQRCTTIDDYYHNGFSISRNVKNYNIKYQAQKINENGEEVLNNEGFPEMEWKLFDIRGKKYSQLPEELQDVFKDRQIPVLYNMNCTKKDIAEDIARFNRSRPMNTAQNGWLGLDEEFADLVEKIAKMDFFQQSFTGSNYTDTNNTSGIIRRIIVESIMLSDFPDKFCSFDKICEFLSEEASDANFIDFYSLVERLTLVCNKEVAKLFGSKDSFLWFALFSDFVKFGLEDKMFIDFLLSFIDKLHSKEIKGVTFDTLSDRKSTKDKGIVIKKISHLKKLMYEYFNIQPVKESDSSDAEFIANILDLDFDVLKEDMNFYNDTLDTLIKNIKNKNSKLLEKNNRLSLLAMIAYSYKEDKDLDEWLKQYVKNNDTYDSDQEKNFIHMKKDFEKFLSGKYCKTA